MLAAMSGGGESDVLRWLMFVLVELFGLSGVGKSSLAAVVCDQLADKSGSSHSFSSNPDPPVNQPEHPAAKTYQRIVMEAVRIRLRREFNIFTKVKSLEQLLVVLGQDLLLTSTRPDRAFVRDDGLFHGFMEALVQLSEDPSFRFGDIVQSRLFVECLADPHVTADRIISRAKSGTRRMWIEGKSRSAIVERVLQQESMSKKLARHLTMSGASVTELDLTHGSIGAHAETIVNLIASHTSMGDTNLS